MFLSSSVTQLNIFVSTILASFLATGSITFLFYGMRFIHFPLGIFGVAIATAVLPTLSAQAARQEMEQFRETLSLGIRLVFFIMFPAMAGLIMLRVPIVNLLLEHGEFNRVSTIGTASALLYYAVGLWAFAGVRVVSQAFYSLQDTKTPVRIALLGPGREHRAERLLIQTPLQHGGLALANSLAAALNITPAHQAASQEDRAHGRQADIHVASQDRSRVHRHGRHRLVGQPEPGVGLAGEYAVQDRNGLPAA